MAPDHDQPMIQMRDVRKSFDGQVVLDGVDLDIVEGKVTTVIGRSGIGKSVLLKHLIGLLEPDGGDILYRGQRLREMSRAERRAMKTRLSYMFQHMALFDAMTVFENIALPLEEKTILSRNEIRSRVRICVDQMELGDILTKFPSQISGGMQKRALARALVTEPDIILFDEPVSGLDPIRKNAVHDMITHYQRDIGFTAVIVSHDIPGVFEISQSVAMLEDGRIVFQGAPEEIQQSANSVVQHFLTGGRRGV